MPLEASFRASNPKGNGNGSGGSSERGSENGRRGRGRGSRAYAAPPHLAKAEEGGADVALGEVSQSRWA